MAESEVIQTAVTQVAIQAATAAVMVLREGNAGPNIRHLYGQYRRGMQTQTS